MSSPQITWDSEPQQIQWDDERLGVPKPPNPILNAPTPSALSRGATAFGAAAGDLFQAGSSMRGGGVPGESFTPSPAIEQNYKKTGDLLGTLKQAQQEKLAQEPGLGSELKGAVTGLGSMIASPVQRALGGDLAGGIGEAAANYPALTLNPEARQNIPEAAAGATRAAGRTMEAHPYVTGHLVGTAAGEMVGHPYLGFIGGRFLEKPIKAVGQRLSKVGAEPPGGPFRNVPEPGPGDVFNVNEPPLEGEYVPPKQAPAPTIPIARAEEVQRPQLPGVGQTSVPRDMPYRVGPGGISPEDVNAPNPRVLAGNKGVRTTPIAALPAKAEEAPAVAAPTTAERIPGVGPHTLSGESALRQVLTGQDNKALLQIAKSRGLNVSQEAQLKPGVADSRIVSKIIDSFSPEELEEMRSKYIENTRMGRSHLGDIGAEAYKTKSLQTYFPDLKISQARLGRTERAVDKARIPAPKEGDLTGVLTESLKQAKKKKGGQ